MDIFSIFALFGGLAFFLYGISIMSVGLENIAGGKLEKLLAKMTASPLKSLLLGVGITAAIQSSSAVTVMLVGLVNSGIMNLSQATGVIMGSNIGTTVTAWLLSLSGIESTNFFIKLLKPESFSPILALVGTIMFMGAKTSKRKSVATVLIGFALLMAGMQTMAHSMSPLADMPEFRQLLTAFTNPILGVLVGIFVTALIQSSSASVGILQAVSLVGGVTYGMAIPIIMGQNIGTCISAVISSIGVNINAKRVAVVHICFNTIGVIICLSAFLAGNAIFHFAFAGQNISPFGIAVIHSIFNIVTTILLFPFTKLLEKLAVLLIKDEKQADKKTFLDERLLITPSIALSECNRKTLEMFNMSNANFVAATKMLKSYHSKKAEQIQENEILIDTYEDKLSSYLLKLSAKELSDEDNNKISQLLIAIGDIERIGDHGTSILKIARKLKENEWKFSASAVEDLKIIVNAVSEIVALSFEVYDTDNITLAQKIEAFEAVIKKNIRRAKNSHIQRLKTGECAAETSFLYSDVLTDLRRIAAHCVNIAIGVIQLYDSTLNKHEYNHRNKEDDIDFVNTYKNYKMRYNVKKSHT